MPQIGSVPEPNLYDHTCPLYIRYAPFVLDLVRSHMEGVDRFWQLVCIFVFSDVTVNDGCLYTHKYRYLSPSQLCWELTMSNFVFLIESEWLMKFYVPDICIDNLTKICCLWSYKESGPWMVKIILCLKIWLMACTIAVLKNCCCNPSLGNRLRR